MMKIGASMLGKSVVCPDCGNRIEVPFESDPRAETLYLRMKQRTSGTTSTPSESSTVSTPSIQQTSPKPQSRSDLPKPSSASPTSPTLTDLSQIGSGQVDVWLESLWADIPDSGVVEDVQRYHDPSTRRTNKISEEETPPDRSNVDRTMPVLGSDSAWLPLAAAFLLVVFLVGVSCGFVLRPLIAPDRATAGNSGASGESGAGRNAAVNGKLSFETPEEKSMPDADAVVIFLPTARSPVVPLSGRGLRPQDGGETETADMLDSTQQIEELGGKCLRTDVDGKFSLTVDADGRYLGILISSHAIRPTDAKWNAETDRNLRRFFREPADLLGNYRFLCEEYELKKGETLSVQYNFSR